MPKSCSVHKCLNYAKKEGKKFSYYHFPGNPERRALWAKACNRLTKTGEVWRPRDDTIHVYVCSAHFLTGRPNANRHHPDYVPNLFVDATNPQIEEENRKKLERYLEYQAKYTKEIQGHQSIKAVAAVSTPELAGIPDVLTPVKSDNTPFTAPHLRSILKPRNAHETQQILPPSTAALDMDGIMATEKNANNPKDSSIRGNTKQVDRQHPLETKCSHTTKADLAMREDDWHLPHSPPSTLPHSKPDAPSLHMTSEKCHPPSKTTETSSTDQLASSRASVKPHLVNQRNSVHPAHPLTSADVSLLTPTIVDFPATEPPSSLPELADAAPTVRRVGAECGNPMINSCRSIIKPGIREVRPNSQQSAIHGKGDHASSCMPKPLSSDPARPFMKRGQEFESSNKKRPRTGQTDRPPATAGKSQPQPGSSAKSCTSNAKAVAKRHVPFSPPYTAGAQQLPTDAVGRRCVSGAKTRGTTSAPFKSPATAGILQPYTGSTETLCSPSNMTGDKRNLPKRPATGEISQIASDSSRRPCTSTANRTAPSKPPATDRNTQSGVNARPCVSNAKAQARTSAPFKPPATVGMVPPSTGATQRLCTPSNKALAMTSVSFQPPATVGTLPASTGATKKIYAQSTKAQATTSVPFKPPAYVGKLPPSMGATEKLCTLNKKAQATSSVPFKPPATVGMLSPSTGDIDRLRCNHAKAQAPASAPLKPPATVSILQPYTSTTERPCTSSAKTVVKKSLPTAPPATPPEMPVESAVPVPSAPETTPAVLQKQLTEVREELRDKNLQIEYLHTKLNTVRLSVATIAQNPEKSRFYTGMDWKNFCALYNYLSQFLETRGACSLPDIEQFFYSLVRLRHGDKFQKLGDHAGVAETTMISYFWKWINLICKSCHFLIEWPDREWMRKINPPPFKAFFPRLTVIIDCFEIFVEAPGKLRARAQCYSNYKKHTTAKFLIGCNPLGAITFLSKAFGGRASDIEIVKQSGFLDPKYHQPGDQVLADRGFTFGDELGGMCGAELLTPSFLKGKSQFSARDLELSRQISSVRIHIERVIGHMKNKFTILQQTLPLNMIKGRKDEANHAELASVDMLVQACAILTNLSPSIVYKE